MAERKRESRRKPEEAEPKQHVKQNKLRPLVEEFQTWNQGESSFPETTFEPRIGEHAAMLAGVRSDEQRANYVMQLQQSYGNQYVQRLLGSMKVQAKLTVSAPNDMYEQEADRVADAVTKAETSQIQRQEEEEELQAQLAESQDTTVSESLETRINHARGSGHPLSDNVREPMERNFGSDFSSVRVHTDSEADALNQQLSAKAFTTGQDIFFRQGEFSPGSDSGKKLIAHELTHVVQQNDNRVNKSKSKIAISKSDKPLKQEKIALVRQSVDTVTTLNELRRDTISKLHSGTNGRTIIQREWDWQSVKAMLESEGQSLASHGIDTNTYKLVKVDTLPWTATLYQKRWWWPSDKKIGDPVQHSAMAYHDIKLKEIGVSQDFDHNEAAATIVHEARHAGQYAEARAEGTVITKELLKESLVKREIEAHIEEEQFRITHDMPTKTAGHPELQQIERTQNEELDRDSVEAYVERRYGGRGEQLSENEYVKKKPNPIAKNFKNKRYINW